MFGPPFLRLDTATKFYFGLGGYDRCRAARPVSVTYRGPKSVDVTSSKQPLAVLPAAGSEGEESIESESLTPTSWPAPAVDNSQATVRVVDRLLKAISDLRWAVWMLVAVVALALWLT
jgi:hypothetical protein